MIQVSIVDGDAEAVERMVGLLHQMLVQQEPVLLTFANVYVDFDTMMTIRGQTQVTTLIESHLFASAVASPKFASSWLLHVAVDHPIDLTLLGDITYCPETRRAKILGKEFNTLPVKENGFTLARLLMTKAKIDLLELP